MAKSWAKTLRFFSYCRVLLSVLEVGAYNTDLSNNRRIGSENFIDVRNSPWFVDKTMLIHEILNGSVKVYLLTYPRKWGKTINLNQIELYFSDLNSAKNRLLFEGTKISLCTYCQKVQALQGKVPVIHIDFKTVNSTSGEIIFLQSLKKVIANSFITHKYLEHFVRTEYGENSSQLRDFRGYVQVDFPEFLVSPEAKLLKSQEHLTHEISKLKKYLVDPTDPHQLLKQMKKDKLEVSRLTNFTDMEKFERMEKIKTLHSHLLSHLQVLEMQKEEDERGVKLRNITGAEKDRLMAGIESLYSPLLEREKEKVKRETKLWKKELSVRQRELKKVRNEIDEVKKHFISRKRIYVIDGIKFLALMLKLQTGKSVVILLDEYDAPVYNAFLEDCGRALVDYIFPTLTEFMGHTFKSQDAIPNKTFESSVCIGIITGVSRIPNLFWEADIVVEHNMLWSKFFMFYGFTGTEVQNLYNAFKGKNPDSTMKEEDLKFYYNGYSKPNNMSLEFYNPWDIVCSLEAGRVGNYFTESETLASIHDLLSSAVRPTIENLIKNGREPHMLMRGLEFNRDDFDALRRLKQHAGKISDNDPIVKLLLITGYLTFAVDTKQPPYTVSYSLRAANREIRSDWSRILISSLKTKYGIGENQLRAAADSLLALCVNPNVTQFEKRFKELLGEDSRFTKDNHGQGLYFTERSCQHVMENVGFRILAEGPKFSFDFGATGRKSFGETRKGVLIFFDENHGVGLIIKMKAGDDVDVAVKEAEEKYSEYLDDFRFIKRKMFLGVNCKLNKTVQMRIVVRDV